MTENRIEIPIPQELVQKNVAQQLGNLMVQLCIKDAIIEKLAEENELLKRMRGDSKVPPPRPVPGQKDSEVH